MKNIFSISTLLLMGIVLIQSEVYAQEKIIPNSNEVLFEVFIDDQPVKNKFEIVELDIVIKPKKSFAEIKLLFKDINYDFTALGKKISVMLGYKSSMGNVFQGKIVKHEIKQFTNEPLIMTIECEGLTVNNKLSKSPVIVLRRGDNVIEYDLEFTDESKLKGELLINGLAESLTGNKVELEGFGKQFDGQVRITKVKHIVKEGSWTTRLFIGQRE